MIYNIIDGLRSVTFITCHPPSGGHHADLQVCKACRFESMRGRRGFSTARGGRPVGDQAMTCIEYSDPQMDWNGFQYSYKNITYR